jgi:hypothetical protein
MVLCLQNSNPRDVLGLAPDQDKSFLLALGLIRRNMDLKRFNPLYWNSSSRGILTALLMLSIAIATYTLVLLIPPPASLIGLLYNFHLAIAFLLVVFFGLVFSRKELSWDIISLTLVLILFGLPLIYKWQTARFYGYMFGGLLPWSDAQGYYTGAHHLMYDGNLSSWATRRPLFAGFLAVLLSNTGNNLQS